MKKTQILKMQTTESESSENFAENTDNKHSSTELVERKQIGNTPFIAVRVNEQWTLTIYKYKVVENLESYEACEDYLADNFWHCNGVFIEALTSINEK